ncbi:inositol polyphosphate-5-phosphatase A-like [Spea bombifrons]|uniref:inositol polyphosphate-5-phosphatase A-like n=1 Tax=Spea bombifrons TaxID=233779 RepID=UPI00234BC739|nr:inositol polyphosphate-5-phosphatase A-like [Spea bombifrons]
MEDLGVLLITANIGSLSDQPGEFNQQWIQELCKTVQRHQPVFISLHLQEVGGKNYKDNMKAAQSFIRELMRSAELSAYDRTLAFIDTDFNQPHLFTALGSVYFIHKSLRRIQIYDFQEGQFLPVIGQVAWSGSLGDCPNVQKERFPQDFWSEFPWTRKGFMRTRWQIDDRTFDLVNLHLFHDASNLVSSDCSPSVYSSNRRKALEHILTRIQDSCDVPFFLFGDFNFRLDLKSLILEQGWDLKTGGESDGKTVEYEQDGEVRLIMQGKHFEHHNVKILQEDSGRSLLPYDSEPLPFLSILAELPVSFPPSYPYSEMVTRPSEFMGTRCPAWCDRVLMSHSARAFLNKGNEGQSRVKYDRIGADVCMGDHKPVYLYFEMARPSNPPVD